MSNVLKRMDIPFLLVPGLLKLGYHIIKKEWCPNDNASNTDLLKKSFIHLDGSSTKASCFKYGFGEYHGEPIFSDGIYILEGSRLTEYHFTTNDIYHCKYQVIHGDEEKKDIASHSYQIVDDLAKFNINILGGV